MPIWEQAIGKEGEEDELRESQKLVSRQSEPRAPKSRVSFQYRVW